MYCLLREKAEEGGPLHLPMEVVEAISHLGIYFHNFEHYRHGLILLQLAEQLMNHMDQRTSGESKHNDSSSTTNLSNGGSSAAKVNSARTHVMFYLAQVGRADKVFVMRYSKLFMQDLLLPSHRSLFSA